MKTAIFVFFSVLIFKLSGICQNANDPISFHFEKASFIEFCDSIQTNTNTKIYYNKSLVDSLFVTIHSDSCNVVQALKSFLKGTGLSVSEWHSNLIILPEGNLITALPDFNFIDSEESDEKLQDTLAKKNKHYITGRKAGANETIIIGRKGVLLRSSKATVIGKVISEETNEPIIGATMYIEKLGTGLMTDKNGMISILLTPGNYNAEFKYLGFEPKRVFLTVLSDGEFKIEMITKVVSIDEVVIFADRQSKITTKDAGFEKIAVKTIKEVPMMMGESNVLKISEMLPGIVSIGEGSAGLNVRGGNYDQNAFYLNKIPIYNTSHLFGFFPSFSSDVIKNFSIYKGHIPAKYGGRLSSVFDIETRPGNQKYFTAHGGISPITTNITLEGPIQKDTCSLFLNARTSYSDWILSKINDPLIKNSSATFNDFIAGFDYNLKKTKLSLFGYYSNDEFSLYDISSYQYHNAAVSMNFSHSFNKYLKGDLTLIGYQYGFSTIDKQEISNSSKHDYKIEYYEVRSDFSSNINDNNLLTYGANFILHKLDRGAVLPYGEGSLKSPIFLGEEKGIESSIYLSDRLKLSSWINLTLGLRYSLFSPIGPKDIYNYEEGMPRDISYITDTLNFNSNKSIRLYKLPDIRASLMINTDLNGSVKISYNQTHQSLFMLNNAITVAPNTQWKLAGYHLKPLESKQISIGVFRTTPRGGWETSVEFYYKNSNNIVEFKDGADFTSSTIETSVLQGNQKAYGVEFLIKRNNRKLDGWLSYTYSRSFTQVNGGQSWNSINEGDTYNSNYDIPHVLNAIINYRLGKRVVMTSVCSYKTGRPITYPTLSFYIDEVQYSQYSKRNEYRIPDYFRIDLSLKIEGNLKRHKFMHSSWLFSVYNLTGRKNAFSVFFRTEEGRIKSYKYSVIGIPILTATWIFKLGNYDAD